MIENFIGTKSRRKFLGGLKRKVDIFIRTKNIFNPKNSITILESAVTYFFFIVFVMYIFKIKTNEIKKP